MGKGTIISGGTDGQYQVSVQYNVQRAQAEKAANLAKIANLNTRIAEETDEQKLNILKLQKLSLEKRNEILDTIPETKEITAWCADLTEDLTGEVGLIEVPGESTAFNIQPGHEGSAAYNAARDGQLTPTMAMDPAAAFYNLAMLPGWQKWKPTYRYGTITAIDGDTADVSLAAATSTQQALGVNQASTLIGVPVEYMSCNGAAFEAGDEVVVKFAGQDWSSPVVVGFKDEPVACEIPFYIRVTFNGLAPGIGGERIYFEYPDDPDGDYEKTYVVPAGGLMGPFVHGADPNLHAIDGTKISLYWTKDDGNSYPGGIFHYFQEDQIQYTHSATMDVVTLSGGQKQLQIVFDQGLIPGADKYFRRVTRMRHDLSIFDYPVTVEEIAGEDYNVYSVDFDLKMIRKRSDSGQQEFVDCDTCAIHRVNTVIGPGDYYKDSLDGNYGYRSTAWSYYNWCYYGMYYIDDHKADNLLSGPIDWSSVVITSDDNGNNPQYTDAEISYNRVTSRQVLSGDGSGDNTETVCEVHDIDMIFDENFEMVNSPPEYL